MRLLFVPARPVAESFHTAPGPAALQTTRAADLHGRADYGLLAGAACLAQARAQIRPIAL